MRTRPLFPVLCALLLAAAPGMVRPAAAQQPGAELLDQNEQRPFETLVRVRDELQLSDAQVARLQGIATRLQATNRPLREELVRRWQAYREQRRAELLRMTPEQREAELARVRAQGRPPVPPELRPLVQRIRGNVAGAMREARSVLTPAQKARARELLRERRQGRALGGRGGRMGRGMMGRGRVRAGAP
jgi:Spy/CpxP family protein refolding chaperone